MPNRKVEPESPTERNYQDGKQGATKASFLADRVLFHITLTFL